MDGNIAGSNGEWKGRGLANEKNLLSRLSAYTNCVAATGHEDTVGFLASTDQGYDVLFWTNDEYQDSGTRDKASKSDYR